MVLLAISAALFFYFKPFFNTKQLIASFTILLVVAWIGISVLTAASYQDESFFTEEYVFGNNFYFLLLAAFVLGLILFLILGTKNLVFIHRQPIYYIFNSILLLAVFILFFNADKSSFFLLKYIGTGLAIFYLFKEFLFYSFGLKKNLIAAVFAFLTLQLVWGVVLLPIGFINSSALALLFALVLQDLAIYHFSGNLTRQVILRNITLVAILAVIIFASSNWSV